MNVFIDSSGFIALITKDDKNHEAAKRVWHEMLRQNASLVTSDYVLVETLALIQRRLGMEVLKTFANSILLLVAVRRADKELLDTAIDRLLQSAKAEANIVDRISFEMMRQADISDVFGFDRHFERSGFLLLKDLTSFQTGSDKVTQ